MPHLTFELVNNVEFCNFRLLTGWLAFGNRFVSLLRVSIGTSFGRYAIGNAERPLLEKKIGWLDHLANTTFQYYGNQSGVG